jgi:NAD-dependent SIR2 family protein deacetylase
MQFVEGGPDIPAEVIAAQEEGRLVFFCGAGISMRARLPDFRGLTERLFDICGVDRRRTREPQYDQELGRLEREVGRAELIASLGDLLEEPENADLSTHEAILELARDPDGEQHLITTNFDLLFESAGASLGRGALTVASAPLLPIPKPRRWRGLVHLHGRLDAEDRDGVGLVLTTADFSRQPTSASRTCSSAGRAVS